jgi:DNA-binding LacI/PurR family transcriptional regulator
MKRSTRPTIKDVAAQVGVSYQTVSRVINNRPDVRPETRDRVLAAIAELGYRPNAAARTMGGGRTMTLGCISPNLVDYTFASILDSVQAEARSLGYQTFTGSAPNADDVQDLLEEMQERQVDGFLLVNPHEDGRFQHLLPLIEKSVPVVYLMNTPDDTPVPTVSGDDVWGGCTGTNYLLSMGHRHVATITGPPNAEGTHQRLQGYRQALAEAEIAASESLVLQGDWSPESGYQAVQRLLEQGELFTAVFTQNDKMALGAMQALREAGLSVPNDVSVMGYDDMPLSAYFYPPLTTMAQPMDKIGRHASRLLIEQIEQPNKPLEQIKIKPKLVERASCAPPKT